jgi:hypothetical protein
MFFALILETIIKKIQPIPRIKSIIKNNSEYRLKVPDTKVSIIPPIRAIEDTKRIRTKKPEKDKIDFLKYNLLSIASIFFTRSLYSFSSSSRLLANDSTSNFLFL